MKMSFSRTTPLLPLLALAAALSGCGHGHASPAQETAAGHASYTAVARGSIDVEGGLLPLRAAVPGIVARVDVHVGDHVASGQALASLHDEDARADVAIAQGKLDQARAQARLIAMQLKTARRRAHTLAEAAAAGAGSGQDASQAAARADQLAAQGEAATAAVSVAKGQLQQAQLALDRHTLRAPMAAQVTRVQVQPGKSVGPASGPLFTLLPDTPRIVVAEIDAGFVAHVHKGMRAQVVLDNDDEKTVGTAHVTYVGQVFGPSTLEQDPAVRANTRTVHCHLRFDHPHTLRIGQRVLVRFLPDRTSKH